MIFNKSVIESRLLSINVAWISNYHKAMAEKWAQVVLHEIEQKLFRIISHAWFGLSELKMGRAKQRQCKLFRNQRLSGNFHSNSSKVFFFFSFLNSVLKLLKATLLPHTDFASTNIYIIEMWNKEKCNEVENYVFQTLSATVNRDKCENM